MRVLIAIEANVLPLEVSLQEPVVEIKKKIEQIFGIPISSQNLAVHGWELVDGLDMEDYPIITEGTKIDLTINSTSSPSLQQRHSNKVLITVKLSARKIDMEVDDTETVRSLKEKIQIIEGMPAKRIALFFSGVELEEEFRYLGEYGISELSELVVFLKTLSCIKEEPLSRKLCLIVQTSSSLLNSTSIPLEVRDTCTVSIVRQLLISRKILPVDDYLFIHKQRIMRDGCSLRWHGVENGDSLYVFKGTVSRNGY